ncbi:MAG: hypothetical protein IPF99_12300 [Deltaproteobacteria bacterium]|nr:hypothetical protein [Deltaproteobacteria bacterium]
MKLATTCIAAMAAMGAATGCNEAPVRPAGPSDATNDSRVDVGRALLDGATSDRGLGPPAEVAVADGSPDVTLDASTDVTRDARSDIPSDTADAPEASAPLDFEALGFSRRNARVWLDPAAELHRARSSDVTDPAGGLLITYLYPHYSPSLPAAQSIALNAVPPEGLRDPDDTSGDPLRFGIVPVGGRRALRMRFVRGQAPVSLSGHLTHRYLMTFDSSVGGADVKHIPFGEDTWIAMAFRAPDPIYRGKVEQGTGASCGDDVLDLGGVSASRAGDSSLYINLLPGNVLRFVVNYNEGATRATAVSTIVPTTVSMAPGEWTYLVLRVRLNHERPARDVDAPRTQIWVAPGDRAPLSLLYESIERNAWAPRPESNLYPYGILRVGPYLWCRSAAGAPPPDPWTPAGRAVFTLDHGGTYAVPTARAPTMTERDVLAFLRAQTL